MSDEATPTTCAIVRVPPLDLDEIEARANAATEGPWKLGPTPHYEVTMADGRPLHATWFGSDVPALCAEVRRLRRMLLRAEEWIRSGAEKIEMLDDDVDGACANARAFADELRADLRDTRQATRDATALGVQFEGVADKLSDIGDRQAAEIQRLHHELWRERWKAEAWQAAAILLRQKTDSIPQADVDAVPAAMALEKIREIVEADEGEDIVEAVRSAIDTGSPYTCPLCEHVKGDPVPGDEDREPPSRDPRC